MDDDETRQAYDWRKLGGTELGVVRHKEIIDLLHEGNRHLAQVERYLEKLDLLVASQTGLPRG